MRGPLGARIGMSPGHANVNRKGRPPLGRQGSFEKLLRQRVGSIMGGRPRIIALAIAVAALLVSRAAHAIDAAVIEAAKREGEVVWYSTQIINQLVRPLAAAFEKKYPGIKVRYTRANANEVAVKIINESRAGRPQSDGFDGTSTVVPLN